MRRQTGTQQTFANSLCRDLGHDWMTTVSANYRVCKREKCRAAERLVAGQWVSNASAYRLHDPVVAYNRRARQPCQTALWEGGYATRKEQNNGQF